MELKDLWILYGLKDGCNFSKTEKRLVLKILRMANKWITRNPNKANVNTVIKVFCLIETNDIHNKLYKKLVSIYYNPTYYKNNAQIGLKYDYEVTNSDYCFKVINILKQSIIKD